MRTTVRLNDELLIEVKTYAANRKMTVTSILEDALRRYLATGQTDVARQRTELPVSRAGGGVRRGVDLDDSAALLDLMDSHAAP